MLDAWISDDITKGSVDLEKYYLKDGDVMSLKTSHRDGRVSVINPIYLGEQSKFMQGSRSLPLVIKGLDCREIEVEYLRSGKVVRIFRKDNNFKLDVS